MDLREVLGGYPGRGIAVHTDLDRGSQWMYFITGRSESSRARRIRTTDTALIVEPLEVDVEHDDLRHYACARRTSTGLVVGNGDHVDVISKRLDGGASASEAIRAIAPEPDPPIYTPRIALIANTGVWIFSTVSEQAQISQRLETVPLERGSLTLLTTYSGTARAPLGSAPTFTLEENRTQTAVVDALWETLDNQLRVAIAGGPLTPRPGFGEVRTAVRAG